jgi:hypothetical protein
MRRAIGWLTAAIIITLIFGSSYAALQQLGRRSANAAPAAAAAAKAQLIGSETLTAPRLELTPDSGVFVIVYGSDNKPESGGTVTLHGSLPDLRRAAIKHVAAFVRGGVEVHRRASPARLPARALARKVP